MKSIAMRRSENNRLPNTLLKTRAHCLSWALLLLAGLATSTCSPYEKPAATGGVTLQLEWEGPNGGPEKYVVPPGVITMRAEVAGPYMATMVQDFDAKLGVGKMLGIPAGTNRTLSLLGLDVSGVGIYFTQITGITIYPDRTVDAGTATMAVTANPTIDNLANLGALETGFVIGTGDTGSGVIVEVSTDGGAYQTASGNANWLFRLPVGGNTWKKGSLHKISARNHYPGSVFSPVTTINVYKDQNRDVDGDGYADVAVGSPGNGGKVPVLSKVHVFHSSGAAGIAATSTAGADTVLTGEASGDAFGYALAYGDMNGDGYGDLIVGAPDPTTNIGKAYVFQSSGSAGIASVGAASANAIITGEAIGLLGNSVAAGDANGDGYDDVAVGSPILTLNQGVAMVFHSKGSAGITSGLAGTADTLLTGESSADWLGYSMDFGDANGDGFADLAVGAPGFNTSTGKAYIFHSGGTGGIASVGVASADTAILGANLSDFLTSSILLHDFNRDGFADLAMGADEASTREGQVYVFYSPGATGIIETTVKNTSNLFSGVVGRTGLFGYSISAGDLNGDNFPDLVVGAPNYTPAGAVSAGRVYAILNGATGLFTSINASTANTIITGAPAGTTFWGISVSASDINGDGIADLISGDGDGQGTAIGEAYVFHGGLTGIAATAPTGATSTIKDVVAGTQFGYTVGR